MAIRMRPDLEIRAQQFQGRDCWVVKDPLALKYYRFEAEELAMLRMLDGRNSPADIQRRFESEFAPQRIDIAEIQRLVGMLHRCGLVIADALGQGSQLLARRRERRMQETVDFLVNLLAIRLRGVDPDRFLSALNRSCGWLFHPFSLAVGLLFGISALLLLFTQIDTLQARLPALEQFFSPRNGLLLATVLAATKVAHELGHGLSCKRYGGECHELGVMFLVFMPCLYCNVSDAWMVRGKWRRAMIGAAGMYVELLLASACTYLWWFSQPGLLNTVCLDIMFICSVSTVLFNANPLMRYDGYYILADLLEIPNLRQKGADLISSRVSAWLFGTRPSPDPLLPRRHRLSFAVFAAASTIYRWLVTLSILWFLYKMLVPYELAVIGHILALASLTSLIAQPAWRIKRFLQVPGRFQQMKKMRLAAALGLPAALLITVLAIPLPYRVVCDAIAQPADAASIYVEAPGTLEQIHVQPGMALRKGEPIVTLANIDMRLTLEKLRGERRLRETRLLSVQQRALAGDERAAAEIETLRESLRMIEQQIEQVEHDTRRLKVVAPRDGRLIPVAPRPETPADTGQLAAWNGSALEPRNAGSFLQTGTPICQVGDPTRLRVVLAIDQRDFPFIEPGQTVQLLLPGRSGTTIEGTIDRVSHDPMRNAALALIPSATSGR
jgi:putative peptide zinc metalloprotease protein